MTFFSLISTLFVCLIMDSRTNGAKILFDFTQSTSDLSNWMEISDTVREVGMSKATFEMQKTKVFNRAVFFSLLNPQLNGACFAGKKISVDYDLCDYEVIEIKCRAQGQNYDYKIVLNHKNKTGNDLVTYEQIFNLPTDKRDDFTIVSLPISKFEAYYRGRKNESAEPLDIKHITSFGLQIFGGVYLPKKQTGVSALEIEYIIATNK